MIDIQKYSHLLDSRGWLEHFLKVQNNTTNSHTADFRVKEFVKNIDENWKLVYDEIFKYIEKIKADGHNIQMNVEYHFRDQQHKKILKLSEAYGNTTYNILSDEFIINADSTHITFTSVHKGTLEYLINLFKPLYSTKKIDSSLQMNFVTTDSMGGLNLNPVDIDDVEVDVDNYYEGLKYDELKVALESDKSGIILMHSEAGCGKTSLIRYLNQEIEKRFIVMNPSTISILENPASKNFIFNNFKDAILVIEDGEKALSDRNMSGGSISTVSTLLNLSDGIEGAALGCKVILTYNNSEHIDKAFLRSGRLLHNIKLTKLPVEKAKKVAEMIGRDPNQFSEPVPLCDVFNQKVILSGTGEKQTKKVGF